MSNSDIFGRSDNDDGRIHGGNRIDPASVLLYVTAPRDRVDNIALELFQEIILRVFPHRGIVVFPLPLSADRRESTGVICLNVPMESRDIRTLVEEVKTALKALHIGDMKVTEGLCADMVKKG